jgi:hypothetical protein
MAYKAKKKVAKTAAGSRKGGAKKARGSRKRRPVIFAFSHPMILVNLADDGATRTMYVGKDPKATKKYTVVGHSFVPIDD